MGGDLGVEVTVGTVLHLVCTGGYMTVCIYENSLNYEHKKTISHHVKYISILKINLTT